MLQEGFRVNLRPHREWIWRAALVILLGWIGLELHENNRKAGTEPPLTEASSTERLQKSLDDLRYQVSTMGTKLETLNATLERSQ
jgi:hypothetical protein